MHIICLTPLAPGVYNDHKADHITAPPEGWAMIPDGLPLPSTFPRLGSVKAQELTYTREVEVQQEATKTRVVEVMDEQGNHIQMPEEYTEMETAIEVQEYTIMTVTEMTDGTLPEQAPAANPEPTIEERVTTLEASNAEMTEALELLLSGETGEEVTDEA